MKNLISTYILIFVLMIVAILLGYNYVRRPFMNQLNTEKTTDQASPSAQAVNSAEERIKKLSVEDKLSQLLAVQISLDTGEVGTQSTQQKGVKYSVAVAQRVRELNPGLVVLFGAHTASDSAETIVDALHQSSQEKWPSLIAINQSNTRRLVDSESFGVPLSLAEACQLEVKKAEAQWQSVGQNWQKLGIAMIFAPVIDLPNPGTISVQSGCSSAEQSLALAKAHIVSFGQYGILPVVAHFPGLGSVKRNPQITIQTAAIELKDLEPFQTLLTEYPNIGVLTSTVIVKDQFAGKPCALSSECLAQFPVKYPTAVLIADQITQQFAKANNQTLASAVQEAILAGNHLVLLDASLSLEEIELLRAQLVEAYASDATFSARVDAVIQKIETLKQPRQIDKPANGAIVPGLKKE